MTIFHITANDIDMGEYKADSAAEALDLYAKDAGYEDYAAVVAQFGDDAQAHQIDVDALCRAVEEKTGRTVTQDSYGRGVALVGDVSYATHADLAQSIDRGIGDFVVSAGARARR